MKYLIIVIAIVFSGCKKDWLDKRSDKKLVIPSTLEDYQALLDNDYELNYGQFRLQELAEQGTDNYYIDRSGWEFLSADYSSQAYIFAKDTWRGKTNVWQWNAPYQRVFVANVILEGLEDVATADDNVRQDLNNIKGQALFLRAHSFFWLSQIYALPYHAATAATDLGIPVRTQSDANVLSFRATMADTYAQMISDLSTAVTLLPALGLTPMRASKAGAHALLARTYLCMKNYTSAALHADSALMYADQLLDFNSLDANAPYPVPAYNVEVIFEDVSPTAIFFPSFAKVDSVLYKMYAEDDLRKSICFKVQDGEAAFVGNYTGNFQIFGGITTSEIYLIKAEALARTEKTAEAMEALNTLLRNRFVTGSFTDLTASDASDALQIILKERRKETCFRGLRWIDIRRLSDEPEFAITVTHGLGEELFTLEPGSNKYAYPIPTDVIQFTGMEQNMR